MELRQRKRVKRQDVLEGIPDEILTIIFSYLTPIGVIRSVSTVCKHYHQISIPKYYGRISVPIISYSMKSLLSRIYNCLNP
jgi:hypothetical protein